MIRVLINRVNQLSMLKTFGILSLTLLASNISYAYFSGSDAANIVQRADIVAVVSIISVESHYYDDKLHWDCGYTVTARVSDALKGVDNEQIIQFGVSDPLKYRTSYLVALRRSNEFDSDNTTIIFDADESWSEEAVKSSSDEAAERFASCTKSLPDLKDIWRFRSEMIGSNWIPLGYKIYFAKDADIEVIGLRISEVAIDQFGEDETTTTFERHDNDAIEPWTKTMLPEEVEYPQVFVRWDAYREYLVRAIE